MAAFVKTGDVKINLEVETRTSDQLDASPFSNQNVL